MEYEIWFGSKRQRGTKSMRCAMHTMGAVFATATKWRKGQTTNIKWQLCQVAIQNSKYTQPENHNEIIYCECHKQMTIKSTIPCYF